jgi:predicted PolB exonuclease-like 3'-5' exonuclease
MTTPTVGKPIKIRRLFADIETCPCIGLFWGAGFKLNIGHENIMVERRIICIGYKWEGDRKTTVLRWDENQCDKAMLMEFSKIANEADEIVGHYGNHFDWPWIRTRILFHKLPPIPVWKTVDTKALASKYFYFNSNKLDYISSFLGHGKKLHTDFDLWKKILLGKCEKSLNYMCRYCGVDVKRLEAVFKDFEPYIPARTHVGVLTGGEKWSCPKDGSTNVKVDKTRATAHGTVQYQMVCLDCGSYYTISSTAHSNYLAWKKQKKEQGKLSR